MWTVTIVPAKKLTIATAIVKKTDESAGKKDGDDPRFRIEAIVCGVVWCGVVWCGVVWCDAMLCYAM